MPDTASGLSIVNLADAIEAVRRAGVPMHGAPAHGLPLHSNGHLGADVVHVAAGEQFPVHTHPGDHLLLCLYGEGTIAVDGRVYPVRPGDIYMVDGDVPHAVGAGDTDHYLVAIGAPHKAVDDPARMAWTDWAGIAVDSPLLVPQGPKRAEAELPTRPNSAGDVGLAYPLPAGETLQVDRTDDAPGIPTRPGQRSPVDSHPVDSRPLASYPEGAMFGFGQPR